MKIRPYQPADCPVLANLFYQTIHSVNLGDYTQQQVDAWATGTVDLERWNREFSERLALIAEEDGIIAGFGDIDSTGYLDRLYVHRNYQRRGVATLLCDGLEENFHDCTLTTHASITARPFFERRGYRVIREQQIERRGVLLTNFVMEKQR